MLKQTIITGLIVGLSVTMTDIEAKRVGGGRSSGASRPAASNAAKKPVDDKASKKTADEPDTGSSASSTSIRPRVTINKESSPSQPAGAGAPATAAMGAAAGGEIGKPAWTPPPAAGPADADELRRRNEEKLLRAAEEEEKRRQHELKRAAALAAYEREQEERRKSADREKQERAALRAKHAQQAQCQFKPVMSDDDIAKCRAIYR
jgi:hypothetical protein